MTSSNPSDRPTRKTGATPLGTEERRKRPWWLVILLAAIVVVVLVLLLSRCGGDDSSGATGASTAVDGSATSGAASTGGTDAASPTAADSGTGTAGSTTTSAAPATSGGAAAGGGALTANTTSLLPLATAADSSGALTAYIGQAAKGTDLEVLSSPADNGFWVGTSTTDQVYVHLLQPGLVSPHPVRAGDHISFTGRIVATAPTLAADDGVDAAEGAAQLTAQKAHIELAKSAVVFTG